jgi:hypothetical protein
MDPGVSIVVSLFVRLNMLNCKYVTQTSVACTKPVHGISMAPEVMFYSSNPHTKKPLCLP